METRLNEEGREEEEEMTGERGGGRDDGKSTLACMYVCNTYVCM